MRTTAEDVVRLLRNPLLLSNPTNLLEQAEEHPTEEVTRALLWCAVDGAEPLRVPAAQLALYHAGLAVSPAGQEYRSLVARFGNPYREPRMAALRDLAALMRKG